MNAETGHLRALARGIVSAAVQCVPVRVALLAGSAGRGNADRFSDIDLLLYVDRMPSLDVLSEIRLAVGGVDPIRRHEPTEHAIGEEFTLAGIRTEVSFTTVARVEWWLDRLLVRLEDIGSPSQKGLSGIAEGLPLHGGELIAEWQTRVGNYPEPLRRAMIEHYWNFFPLWYYGEAIFRLPAERQRSSSVSSLRKRACSLPTACPTSTCHCRSHRVRDSNLGPSSRTASRTRLARL